MNGVSRIVILRSRSLDNVRVAMLIGFGCSVPAIMATRTLSSDRDRKMTILLTPFMSCSAKLPIYALFTTAFFPRQWRAVVMIDVYKRQGFTCEEAGDGTAALSVLSQGGIDLVILDITFKGGSE